MNDVSNTPLTKASHLANTIHTKGPGPEKKWGYKTDMHHATDLIEQITLQCDVNVKETSH